MKLKCTICGEPVSTEVPDGTIVRAWIECPECSAKELEESPVISPSLDGLTADDITRQIIDKMSEAWKFMLRQQIFHFDI
jgi:DNA-directed RNA polymerase subunit RPC12/RpoP